jgi:hypothetical protein
MLTLLSQMASSTGSSSLQCETVLFSFQVRQYIPTPNSLVETQSSPAGRFDLAECFADLMRAVVIHGDDVLAHANWELSLSWMKRYQYVVLYFM